jgi:preprotein translocase subunit SecY
MNTNLQKKKLASLKQRVILTISLLTIIRLGSFIPLPYIDRETFDTMLQIRKTSTNGSLTEILNTFSSGGNNTYSLLSLGILPYINASIIIQLLTTLIPSLAKMQREEGEYGRRKINDYMRYLTFFLSIFESLFITLKLKNLIFNWNLCTVIQISIVLITGSMIVLWFSELITRKGLGNGSSLLICFNIISSLPDTVMVFFNSFENVLSAIQNSFIILIIFFLTTMACIFINEAVINIPLISARQLAKKKDMLSAYTGKTNLPLRINQSGVMPLVFTSYVIIAVTFLGNFIKDENGISSVIYEIFDLNKDLTYWIGKLLFWIFYSLLIFFFTYFYSTITLNPKDVAENFRKNSVIIKGIPPGKATRIYLRETLQRISTINALFLITLIVGLQILSTVLNINSLNINGVGFTSQIILVNVLIDTLKRVRSYLNEEKTQYLDHENINKNNF